MNESTHSAAPAATGAETSPIAGAAATKKDADYVFYELTRSICPLCRKVIDAKILLRDNKVFLRKRCPDCGPFEAFVYADDEAYTNFSRFNKPGTIPLASAPKCATAALTIAASAPTTSSTPASASSKSTGRFDAVICECAFCTFPAKAVAAAEFARVLRPEGVLVLSDITRTAELPPELDGLASWVACIADAQPVESYVVTLERAGFRVTRTEDHGGALAEMARQIQGRLLGLELAAGLKQLGLGLDGADFSDACRWARATLEAIAAGKLSYAALTAAKL